MPLHCRPKDNTPEGWVKIDEKSGQLKVDKDKAIIADAPDGYDELRYDVTATDGENPTTKEVTLKLIHYFALTLVKNFFRSSYKFWT